MTNKFSELGLSKELLSAVKDQGYTKATPIQSRAIPLVLDGIDVLAGAQTGTGKTAGFTLPLLQNLQKKGSSGGKRHIRALVLVPTRELAAQVEESIANYGRYLDFRSMVIFGGVNIVLRVLTEDGVFLYVYRSCRTFARCLLGRVSGACFHCVCGFFITPNAAFAVLSAV